MEVSTTQSPKPNEFVIDEDEAYALTDIVTWEVAEFLMTKLEPIKLEDLDPGDRVCAICQEELFVSEDVRLSHEAVKIRCGHIFGKKCIIRWLDPLCSWGLLEDDDPDADADAPVSWDEKPGCCPTCRHALVPDFAVEPMEELAARLSLWDMAYASAGVARSGPEEQTRKHLWQYVQHCRSMDEHTLSARARRDLLQLAQAHLLDFALCLKRQPLSPVQATLRSRLERIARKDLAKCRLRQDGSYDFDIDRDDNERLEFAGTRVD